MVPEHPSLSLSNSLTFFFITDSRPIRLRPPSVIPSLRMSPITSGILKYIDQGVDVLSEVPLYLPPEETTDPIHHGPWSLCVSATDLWEVIQVIDPKTGHRALHVYLQDDKGRRTEAKEKKRKIKKKGRNGQWTVDVTDLSWSVSTLSGLPTMSFHSCGLPTDTRVSSFHCWSRFSKTED